MKAFHTLLALGALALVGIAAPARALDATTSTVVLPHPLRCTVCGAPMEVVAKVGKNNTIELQIRHTPATGNPRGN